MADDEDEEVIQEYEPKKTVSEGTDKPEDKTNIDLVNRNAEYQIRPPLSEKFKSMAVKEVINTVLNDELWGKVYSEEESETWTKNIVSGVKEAVKELGFKRYKLIVQTILGQNKGSGVKIGARCIWDADTDNCASDSFLNDTIFCCVIVFDRQGLEGSSWEDIADKYGKKCSSESEEEDIDENFISLLDLPEPCLDKEKKKKSEDLFSLENTYLITNYTKQGKDKNKLVEVDKLLEKSCLGPGLEQLLALPVKKNKRALKRERKAIRDKTKGKDWFNLPAPEMTDELKNDLEILKMRSVLDSKHFYKKNDITGTPKYFQVGKVVEGPADFYSGRIPKSQRKRTLVEELLADSNFKAYQKKKYKEIVDSGRHKGRKRRSYQVRNDKKRRKGDDWLSFD